MKIHLRPFEYILHAYMLVLLSSAFVPLWQTMRTGAGIDLMDGDPLSRMLLMAGYGLTLPFLLLEPHKTIRKIASDPWIWALIGFALLSVFWSQLPTLTLRRAIAVILTTLYALVLAQRFTTTDFLKLLGVVFFIMLASSLIMVIFTPSWGIMTETHIGAWQGIFVQKNILGRISTIGLLVFSCLLAGGRKWQHRRVWGTGLVMAVATLFGSRSTTALVMTMIVLLSILSIALIAPLNKKRNFLFFLFLGAIGSIILLILFYSYVDILALFGKDPTLTGRVPLWQASLEVGLQRPWVGWGFSAFWLGWQGTSAQIWSAVLWEPPHAHNGYLDLFLNLGAVGLVFGLIILVKSGLILLKSIWQSKITSTIGFLFGLWIFMLVYNLNESAFLRQNNLMWVLLIYISFQYESGWVTGGETLKDRIFKSV